MAYGSQRRAGAPDTVNLGPSVIETMISGTPLSWLLPIYGLIDPIEIDTDDLCASIPGYPESWGVSDMLAGIDPASHPDVLAKLIRMARASVWGTYCELSPPTGGLPRLLEATVGSEFDSAGAGGGVIVNSADLFSLGADFHVLYIKNLQGDPTGNGLRIRSGPVYAPTSPVLLGIGGQSGAWVTRLLTPGDVVSAGPPEVVWDGTDPFWSIEFGPDSEGRWLVHISSWALTDDVPLPVTAWPPAPAEPWPAQFTDECRDLLCTMATEWSAHRIAGAIVPGMLTELLAGLVPADTELVAGPSVSDGGEVIAIPTGIRGVAISVTVPAHVAHSGNAPLTVAWDIGYVAVGRDSAWWPSERIKHPIQLVYPFPAGVTHLAVDLATGVSAELAWLSPV